jgi:hypothetical protein
LREWDQRYIIESSPLFHNFQNFKISILKDVQL